MESYKQEYKLIQQTPIIHFQHMQNGATLRATEVKPKLDRFIVEQMGGRGKIPSSWFVKSDETDKIALDYKMKFEISLHEGITEKDAIRKSKQGYYSIEAYKCKRNNDEHGKRSNQRLADSEINKMYFANMVSSRNLTVEKYKTEVEKNFKETVFCNPEKCDILLTIICFKKDLMAAIKKYIDDFFIIENFGSRQSKGFGCFITEDGMKKSVGSVLNEYGYKYFYAECQTKNNEKLMNIAMTVYAVLKGGLHMSNPPIKGYIQRGFINSVYGKEIVGDKAAIVKMLNGEEKNPNDVYYYVRALLGFADHYEFRHKYRGNVYVYSLGENDFNICRFRSPVTIKIFGKQIFFYVNKKAFSDITGQTFYFLDGNLPGHLIKYSDKKNYIENHGLEICTPKKFDDDDIDSLISGFVAYFNKNREKLQDFSKPFNDAKDTVLEKGVNISD